MTETERERLMKEIDARAAVIAHELPPQPSQDAAITAYVEVLTARVLPRMNAEDDPALDLIDNQRHRYVRTLRAIAMIDDDNLVPQGVGIYIMGLAVALENLNKGVIDPLFAAKRSKSTRDSDRRWAPRLPAALGVECLVLANCKREDIEDTVIRHHSGLARLMRSTPRPPASEDIGYGRDLGSSVLNWNDRFLKSRVPNDDLVEAFHEMRRKLNAARLEEEQYRKLAKQYFEMAIKTASR